MDSFQEARVSEISILYLAHVKVTATDTAADIEDSLARLEVELLQKGLARLLTTGRDVAFAVDLLVAENTVGGILLLVEKLLDGLETVVVVELDFLEEEAHLVAVVLELNEQIVLNLRP